MTIILTFVYSFPPPKPLLNRTIDSGLLEVKGQELDKTRITEEDKHKSPPGKLPQDESKYTITIPADETSWEQRTETLKEEAAHDHEVYPGGPRNRVPSITIREFERRAPMKRTSNPLGKGIDKEQKSARQ